MPQAPLLVKGTVLDTAGQPVGGARLMWLESPVAMPDVAALSQADGSFVLTVPVPGRYRLGCQTDAQGSAQAAVNVRPDGAALQLTLIQ